MVDAGAHPRCRRGVDSTRCRTSPGRGGDCRVVPVIERLSELDVAISVDTRKAPVARAALDAGADILNDVSGLEDPEMRLVAAEHDAPVVVMHSIDATGRPGRDVHYDDVVEDCIDQLTERILLAEKAGLAATRLSSTPASASGSRRRKLRTSRTHRRVRRARLSDSRRPLPQVDVLARRRGARRQPRGDRRGHGAWRPNGGPTSSASTTSRRTLLLFASPRQPVIHRNSRTDLTAEQAAG